MRQHTYINIPIDAVACVSIRQHTSAYVYKYTYTNIPIDAVVRDVEGAAARQEAMSHVYIHRIFVTGAHVLDYYSQSCQRWTP
jgi:glutamate mutase epsilon subunit